ncbi:MAG: SCP-like extracellular [Bacteroidetes bacterium]|nr:SCP-like extracellular [Bacteroidota bacterium]
MFTKSFFTALLGIILIIQFSYAQSIKEKKKSRFSPTEIHAFINHHNQVRKEVNVPALEWDAQLANYAQEWADYLATKNGCEIKHRDKVNKKEYNYGENIYWGSNHKVFSTLSASESWYSEKTDYQYQSFKFPTDPVVGHYTQMIWKNTTAVGAGKAICPNGAIIVVANYNPPGNYIGEYPY